jgi:23S rRNA (uracil1939-C5)-methyltransferase
MKKAKPEQIYEQLEISGMSSDGRGIARFDNLVVFVEGAVSGDVADVRVFRKKSGYREASVIKFHKQSEKRSTPVCTHFSLCGGCTWQNLKYSEQLIHKEKTVIDALRRIGKIELPEHNPIIGAPHDYGYRNKMEYTFSATRWLELAELQENDGPIDKRALGFHIPGRFDKILPIEQCHLQDNTANRIRNFVRDYTMNADFTFYHPRSHEGFLRNLMLRNTRAGEWMVVLSATEENEELHGLMRAIQTQFPEITSLMYAVNTKKNDVWYDLDIKLFHGKAYIEEQMERLRFRIGPKSFYQTNPEQAERLYGKVREMAQLTGNENVYDLYTGTGTIALFLARSARFVTGVEYVEAAVEDARINARENGIEHVQFFAGDMKDVLTASFFEMHGAPDVIVADPPRAGMHPDVCARIAESGASKVVYVSCNPSTQARDLALLDEKYSVQQVQPVDMFPQTTHVENIVLLNKR